MQPPKQIQDHTNKASAPGPIRRLLQKLAGTSAVYESFDKEVDHGQFGFSDQLSTKVLSGGSSGVQRTRQDLYDKYQAMLSSPIISQALRLHITSALGGNETTGDTVLIEQRPEPEFNTPEMLKYTEDAKACLTKMFNRIAPSLCFNATAYGDGYARIYSRPREGVLDLSVDETMLPPLVQPYEQGNKTRICILAIGKKLREKLTMDQIARMKMPRLNYSPQPMAVDRAWKAHILEDDPDKLILMPSLVGGSFLADCETEWQNFTAALAGLVGQRILDSIDETIILAQVQGLTKEQRKTWLTSVADMLKTSRDLAAAALAGKTISLGRIRHILPIFNEKQMVSLQGVNSSGGSGAGRAGNVSIDDVMLHAKLLGGALGIDISMLGFADLLSGGLGDGGFFRNSAQAAERSRMIRSSLVEALEHVSRVHVMLKFGNLLDEGKLPFHVVLYGSISALETEKQRTETEAMNTSALLVQTMAQLRDLGLDEQALTLFLKNVAKLSEADAEVYAKALIKAKAASDKLQAQNAGFGAPGGDPEDPEGGFGDDDQIPDDGGGGPALAPKQFTKKK